MSIRKRFDQKLFNKTDNKARTAIKNLFKGFSGWSVKDNPSKTGVDLIVYKDDLPICNIETEIKLVWTGKDFPYESLHIPERKGRYESLPLQTIFIVFNKDCSSFLIVFGDDLYKANKVEVPNKYVFKGELFYDINVKKTIKNHLRTVLNSLANGAKNHRQFEKESTEAVDSRSTVNVDSNSKRHNKRTGVKYVNERH